MIFFKIGGNDFFEMSAAKETMLHGSSKVPLNFPAHCPTGSKWKATGFVFSLHWYAVRPATQRQRHSSTRFRMLVLTSGNVDDFVGAVLRAWLIESLGTGVLRLRTHEGNLAGWHSNRWIWRCYRNLPDREELLGYRQDARTIVPQGCQKGAKCPQGEEPDVPATSRLLHRHRDRATVNG